MTDGQASAPLEGMPSAAGSYLLQVVADVSDLKARVAVVERAAPELAARLDGRIASVEGHIDRMQDHLSQQDQTQAAFRLEVKSGLGTLQAAEQQRAVQAKEAADRAAAAQQRSQDQATEQRKELRRWAMQTVASMALTLPGVLWPLIVTRPLALRLGVPAACITLVLLLAAWAWARSRR